MSSVKVCVLIPNYNKDSYLAETLESLINQSENQWEAIILDSFSSDNSWDIIGNFSRKDSRIKALQLPRPKDTGKTLYRAWNTLLHHINAPYFAILTSDDTWQREWLSIAIAEFENNPDANVVATRTRLINTESNKGDLVPFTQMFENLIGISQSSSVRVSARDASIASIMLGPIFSSIHSILIRSDLIRRGCLFAEDLGFAADHEFYLQLCQMGPIIYSTKTEALFRIYDEQASFSIDRLEKAKLFSKIVHRNISIASNITGLSVGTLKEKVEQTILRRTFQAYKPSADDFASQPFSSTFRAITAPIKYPIQTWLYVRSKLCGERFIEDYCISQARQLMSSLTLH